MMSVTMKVIGKGMTPIVRVNTMPFPKAIWINLPPVVSARMSAVRKMALSTVKRMTRLSIRHRP